MNSCVIAFSNSLFSFIAGFAVFAVLGHLALVEDTEIDNLGISGFTLVFGSWPVALSTIPGGQHWIRLLFFMLFILGIDSAFSFLEAFLISLGDTVFLRRFKKQHAALLLSVVAWLFSFIYATDAGLVFLDTIGYYINFAMLLVGFAECFAAGWIYNFEEQLDNLGVGIVCSYATTTFGSLTLASILWFSVDDAKTALVAGFVGLVLFYAVGMALVTYLMHKRKQEYQLWGSWRGMFYDLTLRNVMDLRDDLSGVVGYLPVAWAVLIKHVIPQILLVLFCMACAAKTPTGRPEFGHYGGYPALPYQTLGVLTVVFAGFLVASSAVAPAMYDAFQKPDSPVPSKEATVQVSPEPTKRGESSVALSFASTQAVWPPRSINVHSNVEV